MLKRNLDASLVSWSPSNVDDGVIEEIDPSSDRAEGTLTVQFTRGSTKYSWLCSYEKYLEFKAAGFDIAWLNENAPIEYSGDWGWPYGRTSQTGWAAPEYNKA